jgi:hypothetical protein
MLMTRPSVKARGIYIASLVCDNDNNYGNDDDQCQQRGLGRERPAFASRHTMATTTATTAMMMMNVNNEALSASTRNFYIALLDSNDNKCQTTKS